jgi:hypothetical protein
MNRSRWMNWLSAFAVAGIGIVSTANVRASGYWNMPGTHEQWAGHGYSGGYHAPFILGPHRFDGWHKWNEVRWPHAPVSSLCGAYSLCSSYDCGRMIEEPSAVEGVVPTSVAPEPLPQAPVEAPTKPILVPSSDTVPTDAETMLVPTAEPTDAVTWQIQPTRPLFGPPVQR